jgi:hypothetical protein
VLASLALLSLLFPSSTAATQFALKTRVTQNFDTAGVNAPFTTAGSVTDTSDAHTSLARLCDGSAGVAAYLTASFSTYVPTMGVRFWLKARDHQGGSPTTNLSLAKIQFLSPAVALIIVRNKYGYFNAYFDNSNATATSLFMEQGGTAAFYEVNVHYATDDDVAKVYVTREGGTAVLLASKAFASPFKAGMSVTMGVFNGTWPGIVVVDDFTLYASPMLNISKPIVNAGDTITISGKQFSGSSQVNLTIRSAAGQVIFSNPTVSTQADGSFSQAVVLPSQMAVGLYYVSARQPTFYSGEVLFHLGVWGILPSQVNRTVPFNVTGYAAKPGTLVSLTIDKVAPPSLQLVASATPAYSPDGRFVSSSITIVASQPLGLYKAKIAALGTIDYASYSFDDDLTFNVGPAPLTVTVMTDATLYMRTQTVRVTAVAKYRNATTVSSVSNFLVDIRAGTQIIVVSTPMTYSPTQGLWTYERKLLESWPTGLYEVTVSLSDPAANTGVGRANFTVTAASIQAQFDFEQVVQRSETINISAILKYPDNTPVYQGTFSLIVRHGATSHVSTLRYLSSEDRWRASVTISPGDPIGSWTLMLSGADVNANVLNVSVPFTVDPATLTLSSQVDLNVSYQRTSSILFEVVVRYPSFDRVMTGTVNATISFMGGTESYSSSLAFIPTAQAWRGYLAIPRDAPEGVYAVVVHAADPYGNEGNLSRVINVIKATLVVDISADKREFQVGFDTVRFSGKVYYPDDTVMVGGSVTLEVAIGSSRKVIDLQPSGDGLWTGTMQTGFFDSGGEYSILIRASDAYGNSGTTAFSLTASQLYVIFSLIAVALSLAIAIALIWRFRQSRAGLPSAVGVEYEHYL